MAGQLTDRKKEGLKDKNHWIRKRKIIDFMLRKGYEYEIVKDFL